MSSQFDPKEPVQLKAPSDHEFTRRELLQYDGVKSDKIFVAIKGVVFDVSNNTKAYGPNTSYHIFTGKDSSRGLAKSSLKEEDNSFENSYKIEDLTASELLVLEDWNTFFSKRYNIVGKVVD